MIKRFWLTTGMVIGLLVIPSSSVAAAATVFCNANDSTSVFAARDIKAALIEKGNTVSAVQDVGALTAGTETIRVVLSIGASGIASALSGEGGAAVGAMQPQGYTFRKTTSGSRTTFWVIGVDGPGTMYGGLDLAELIQIGSLGSFADGTHNPYIAKRGIKYHLDLDSRTPSYTGAGTSAQESIEYNWDINYWHDYLDAMARQRFNTIFLWSFNPFPSMVRVPEYPNAALADVYRTKTYLFPGFRGDDMSTAASLANLEKIKTITMDQKIAFWKEVMQYAANRGVGFYFYTWNAYTYGLEASYPNLKTLGAAGNNDYFYTSAKALLLTYPLIKGMGAYAGEKMADVSNGQAWLFDTYGRAINAAIAATPGRQLEWVGGDHETTNAAIDAAFSGKINCTYSYDTKYSRAHMIGVTTPVQSSTLTAAGGAHKCWLLCRDDDSYMFRWGNPAFMQAYFKNMPVDKVAGVQIGANLVTYGRESGAKDPFTPRQIYLEKNWFKTMLFGRSAYDPNIPIQQFKDMLAYRYAQVSSSALYEAWTSASQVRNLVTSFNYGGNENDYNFVMENCYSMWTRVAYKSSFAGFVPIKDFVEATPHVNSGMISVSKYASGTRTGITPVQLAQTLDSLATRALALRAGMTGVTDKETNQTLGDIQSLAYLGQYYADKIRAATNYAMNNKAAAQQDAANAACHWRTYAASVALFYNPVRLSRLLDPTQGTDNGYVSISKLQTYADLDYADIGGTGAITCPVVDIASPVAITKNQDISIYSLSQNRISFKLSKKSSYTVSLYQISGRKIFDLNSGKEAAQGLTTVNFNAKLFPGLYLVRIVTPDNVLVARQALSDLK